MGEILCALACCLSFSPEARGMVCSISQASFAPVPSLVGRERGELLLLHPTSAPALIFILTSSSSSCRLLIKLWQQRVATAIEAGGVVIFIAAADVSSSRLHPSSRIFIVCPRFQGISIVNRLLNVANVVSSIISAGQER